MNRRDFLRRSALIAVGVVAADQIELLERLAPRRLWPSIGMEPIGVVTARGGGTVTVTYASTSELQALYRQAMKSEGLDVEEAIWLTKDVMSTTVRRVPSGYFYAKLS